MVSDAESARLDAACSRLEAALSPEQWADLHVSLVELGKVLEQSDKCQKNLLRRLGVRTNLGDREEFWVRLWAAARYAGFSDKEFWGLTARELCAVLELKATEFELLAGATASVLRTEAGGGAAPKAVETASAQTQPGTIPNSEGQGRKRGPKPNYETASRVADIVALVAPDGDWRSKLDDVCVALDEEQIPIPQTWLKRDPDCRCWLSCHERPIIVKAIEYRLKVAKQRKKPTPETLS